MLTKKDLQDLRKDINKDIEVAIAQIMTVMIKTCATKDDLKGLATKDDIKRDIQDIKADMPTKDDFRNLKKLEDIHRKELGAYA